MSNRLDSLFFVSVPSSTHFSETFAGFDSEIPIPVQLSSASELKNSSALTREAILSGILLVLAWDRENQHIEYYQNILKTAFPTISQELTEAAILKIKNGDFELAEEIFMALLGLNPNDSQSILNMALLKDEHAVTMRNSGLDEEAEALDQEAFLWYKHALSLEPPMPNAFFNAGFFYLRQRNYQKARTLFETFLSIETATDENTQDKKEKAQEIIQNIRLHNLDDELIKAAYDCIMQDQAEKALEHLRSFMETHPKVWHAWFLLGWALRKLNRFQEAKAAFIQALELGNHADSDIVSATVDICNELSICTMELGDFKESRRWLETGLAENPENVKIITNLGVLSLKEGKTEEAKAFFKTALEIDPVDQIAINLLQSLE